MEKQAKISLIKLAILSLIFLFVFLYSFIFSVNASTSFSQVLTNDTWINSQTTITQRYNYGGSATFQVDGDPEKRALILFDLSSIPQNSTINSANLFLFRGTGSNILINIYIITNSWTEGTNDGSSGTLDGVTWLNRTGTSLPWDTPGGDFNPTIMASFTSATGANNNVDIRNIVQAFVNGTQNNGILLDTASTLYSEFYSKDSGTVSRRPNITVSWDYPVPSMSFISPENNTVQSSSLVNLTCNSTLLGIDSNANFSGFEFRVCDGAGCNPSVFDSRLVLNESDFGYGNKSMTQNWSTTLTEGIHEWDCYTDVLYENGVEVALVGSPSGQRRITVDTIPPQINFTSPTEISGTYLSRNYILINVTANDSSLSTILITLYNSTHNLINSSLTTTTPNYINFSGLSDGIYYFNATANDTLNNANSTSTRNITIDTTKPIIEYGTGTENSGSNFSRTWIYVNVSVTELNFQNITFLLYNTTSQVNKTSYSTEIYFINWTNLIDGNYTYNVSVTDKANNINSSVSRTLKLDTISPIVTIVRPINGTFYKTLPIVFNITLNEIGGSVLYSLNSGVTNLSMSSTNGFNYNASNTSLADGIYTFRVYANDSAGNRNDTAFSTFIFDTTSPSISITSPSNNTNTTNTQLNINYTVSDTNLNICWYTRNSGATNTSLTSCVNITTVTWNQGTNNVTIYANDSANNVNSSSVTFFLDSVKPLPNIIYPANTTYTINVSALNYTFTELNPSRCWYSIDLGTTNSTSVACGTNFTGITSTEGSNTWTLYMNDTFGNFNFTSVTFSKDTIFPSISITSPSNNSNTSNTQIGINYTASDTNLQSCWWTKNSGTTNTSITCGTNITGQTWSEELNTIRIYANDSVNNVNSSLVTFRLDTTPPSISIASPLNTTYTDLYSYNLTLNVSSSDSGVGISSYWYSLNSGNNITFTPNTTIIATNNSNTVKVWVNDTLNNVNSSSITFYLAFTPRINDINISNVSNSYSRNNLLNGLVGWWKLDENNTNQIDSSIYSSNLSRVSSNPYFQKSGKVGGSYEFDGIDDYFYSDSDINSLDFGANENFTITGWVYRKSSVIGVLVGKGFGGSGPGYGIRMDSRLFCWTGNGTGSSETDTGTINLNEWAFISCVREGNKTFSFINGVNVENETSIYNLNLTNSGVFYIGARSSQPFNGTIDEVRIYNRSLSASEISELYSITNPTFQEYANVTINVTITDEDTPIASLYFSWFVSGILRLSGFAQGIFNWIFTSQNQNVTLIVNDSNGYSVTQNWNITTTFINPTINFTSPTPTNNTYQTSTTFTVNYTGTETNRQTGWINLDTTNYTATCIGTEPYYCNYTFIGITEGIHTYKAYINDTVGNINNTETRTITIDLTNPSLNIVYPSNGATISLNESVNFNYTALDTNLQACWWNLDNGANSTITCGQNATFNASETTHTINLYANDSSGRNSNISSTFTLSLASPSIVLYYPSDNLWINYKQNVPFNYTATDTDLASCQLWTNSTGTWAVNQTHNPTSGVLDTFYVNFSDSSLKWNIFCNDSLNSQTWGNSLQNLTLNIDSTYPLISYGTGTENSGSNFSRTWIYVNVSVTELNFQNITFLLYNTSSQVNKTIYTTETYFINWTTLLDGNYTYNVSVTDKASNTNTTSQRTIILDDTPPEITIDFPQPINYASNNSLSFNYTITDNVVGVSSCWFNVQNSSDNFVIQNTTLINCQNTTFSLPSGDIDYYVNLYANDTLNNNALAYTVNFGIRTIAPAIVLNNPTSDQHFNRLINIRFNMTATDTAGIYDGIDQVDTCNLYGNWTGAWQINQTNSSVTSGTQTNFNLLNLTEGTFLWNVWCNDTLNNADYALNNYSFTTDITYPIVNITSITGSAGSPSISVNYVYTEIHPNNCYYSIFNSTGGIDGISNNISIASCVLAFSASITTIPATYNMTVYVKDKATNVNSSTYTFTVTSAGVTPGGGGGGEEPEIIEVPSNKTFCGDGICQRQGNDLGSQEDFFSCEQDCPTNIENAIWGCFDNDPSTDCIWNSVSYQYIALSFGVVLFTLALSKVEDKSGKQVPAYQYVYMSYKRRRRRRR